jgi:hypothetical protein
VQPVCVHLYSTQITDDDHGGPTPLSSRPLLVLSAGRRRSHSSSRGRRRRPSLGPCCCSRRGGYPSLRRRLGRTTISRCCRHRCTATRAVSRLCLTRTSARRSCRCSGLCRLASGLRLRACFADSLYGGVPEAEKVRAESAVEGLRINPLKNQAMNPRCSRTLSRSQVPCLRLVQHF